MTYTWSASCSELALLISLELESFGVLENRERCKLDEISDLNSHRPTIAQHKDNRISNQTTPFFQLSMKMQNVQNSDGYHGKQDFSGNRIPSLGPSSYPSQIISPFSSL